MTLQTDPESDVLSVSIIVTNYNYGHYLEACLDSLRAQTVKPDEIIVVNDGSTDGSAEILARLDGVRAIDQPNGGQAAAFNAGFAASSGQIVMFVDADDKLRPTAVEAVRRLWSSQISALSYGLGMIDGDGQGIGQYAMDLPDTDLLPRLLGQLTIPFMPTSGNAFARAAIDWAFPLPTERWRISADALLIRAAILAAPIRHVRQVLGDYRVHGQNSYFRAGASGPWKANRGLRDISEAGLDLIDLTDRAKRGLSPRDRTKLLFAAVRTRLMAEDLLLDAKALAQFQGRVLRAANTPRLYAYLWLTLRAARASEQARKWAIDPRICPRLYQTILSVIRGRKLNADLAALVEPRAPFDSRLSPQRAMPADPMEWLSGPEWTRDHGTGGADLCAACAQFVLHRSWAGPAKLTLHVAPRSGPPVRLEVSHNGLPLGSHDVKKIGDLSFTLPEARLATPEPDRIVLRVSDLAPGRFGVLSSMWREAHRLQVRRLRLEPIRPEPASATLPVSDLVAFGQLGDVVQTANGTVLQGDQLIGSGETLSVAVPPLKAPFCLALRLSEDQVAGHLTISYKGQMLCAADVAAGGECLIEMPASLTVFNGPALLEFGFRPVDFLDDAQVALSDLGWVPQRIEGRYGLPALTPGAWAGQGTGRDLHDFLGDGWQQMQNGAAVMLGASAQLILSQAAVARDCVLRLDLEPMDALAAREALVVMVHVNGAQRAAVQLAGQVVVEIDMAGVLSGPRHKVEVELYAATRPGAGDEAHDHGGIRLNGLSVSGPQAKFAALEASFLRPDTDCARLLSDLSGALRQGVLQAKLEDLRAALLVAVARLSPQAARGCLSADDLKTLCAVSSKLPSLTGSEAAFVHAADWVKPMALAILRGPAFETLQGVALADLPEVSQDFAGILGAYLVADPISGAGRAVLEKYQAHLVAMFDQARAILASAPEESPRALICAAMLTSFRGRQLLFSALPLRAHVTAFGRALEAMLLRAGHDVFAPQLRVGDVRRGKPRIGVLLHNSEPSPETWIWRAILRRLAKDQADITVFFTEQNDPPKTGFEACRTIGLAGKSLATTVSAIRRERMDVVLLGANFYGHCFMTEVCAHRLAPRQIAMSAVFPATTGLSSVDTFVLGQGVAPKHAAVDYCEEVVLAPGTGQAFDFPPVPLLDAGARAVTRRRIGVGEEDVMLVSGAMQDKIGADLLTVWTKILSDSPKAVLLLYPFAASWQQNYDAPAFGARVAQACKAQGVDPRRVRILPPIPNHEVKQVLAAADLYLDSFPYSGATTTVEALLCGVPVVALKGQTQRGHQAAGWLAAFGVQDLVAGSMRTYVTIAAGLAGDPGKRSEAKSRIESGSIVAVAQDDFARWLRGFVLPQEAATPRYLFHHMPKTGGTSLKRVFAGWFDLVEDYRAPWAYIMPPKLDLGSLSPAHLLCGHFAADTAPLGERYPETSQSQLWRKITFVRDPLERAISIHAYEKKLRLGYDQNYSPQPLSEYLRTNRGIFLDHFECSETNWRAALDRYWFIGTLERLPESLDYLAAQLGKSVPEFLPHENTTTRDEEVSKDDIAAFRATNAIEFEIYDAVAARLDELLREHAGN